MSSIFNRKKHALGIFEEGSNLYTVCLAKENGKVEIVNTKIYDLEESKKNKTDTDIPDAAGQTQFDDQVGEAGKDETQLDLSKDISQFFDEENLSKEEEIITDLQKNVLKDGKTEEGEDFYIPQSETGFSDKYLATMRKIVSESEKPVKLAFSFQEPYLYQANFPTDWGLEGKKLKQRTTEELVKENPDITHISADEIEVLKTTSGEITAFVNERASAFRNMIDDCEKQMGRRLPNISFIESPETSLINLVKLNYAFSEEEITVIVYVGSEYSRILFLQGTELFHLPPRIDEGIDSIIIFDTIYNRIILEQDNLNLPKIHRIITAGEAKDMGVKYYLSHMFPEDLNIQVEDIELDNLVVDDSDDKAAETMSKFAVPISAAWRALDGKNRNLNTLDLLPHDIHEKQKVFKLGWSGWLLLSLIFFMSLFFTFKMINGRSELAEKINLHENKIKDLDNLRLIESELLKAAGKLDNFKKTYGVLDSMMARTKNWNGFLKKLAAVTRASGGIWISEIIPGDKQKIKLKGYSLYRNRISKFSDNIGLTLLKKVEVAEIRKQTVYYFEINAEVPVKKRDIEVPVQKSAIKTRPPQKQKTAMVAANPIKNEAEFEQLYKQGRQLYENYKYSQAITIFKDLVASGYPSELQPNCHYWIGESYFGIKKYQAAVEAFQRASEQKSLKRSSALFMMGKCYIKLGDKDLARKYLDQVIEQYPKNRLAGLARSLKKRLI